jgi:hypothetical protein
MTDVSQTQVLTSFVKCPYWQSSVHSYCIINEYDFRGKKNDLISWLTSLDDEEVLRESDQIRKNAVVQKYKKVLVPMSVNEYVKRIDKAENDFRLGKVFSHDKVKNRFKVGKTG